MTDAAALTTMTDREAVAYWNILQFNTRMLHIGSDGGKDQRHLAIMDSILTERGIAHEAGHRTVAA